MLLIGLVKSFISRLRISIDDALTASYRKHRFNEQSTFIGHISLVKGVPFYGYHVGYEFYLKIYLRNPMHMTRFADLLQQGAIMNTPLQPHESHLQYILQWMCDFNLYGCAFVECSRVCFRSPVPSYLDAGSLIHRWHDHSVPKDWISNPDLLPKQSHCSLEVDICVEDILNRHEIKARDFHIMFNEPLGSPNANGKLVHSMAGLWRDETIRRRKRMGILDPNSSPFPPGVLTSMSAESRQAHGSRWIHEQTFREALRKQIEGEGIPANGDLHVEDPATARFAQNIKTALESVEDLFSRNLQRVVPSSTPTVISPPINTVDTSLSSNDNATPLEDHSSAIIATIQDKEDLSQTSPGTNVKQLSNRGSRLDSGSLATFPTNKADLDHRKQHQDKPLLSTNNHDDDRECSTDGVLALKRQRRLCDERSSRKSDVKRRKANILSPSRRDTTSDEPDVHLTQSNFQSVKRAGSWVNFPQLESIKAGARQDSSTGSSPTVKTSLDPNTINKLSQSKFSSGRPSMNGEDGSTSEKVKSQTSYLLSKPRKKKIAPLPFLSARGSRMTRKTAEQNLSLCYAHIPPSRETVVSTMMQYSLPEATYQDAYYKNDSDVPACPREYAGKEFILQGTSVPFLPEFQVSSDRENIDQASWLGQKKPLSREQVVPPNPCSYRNWEILALPPTALEVRRWVHYHNMRLDTWRHRRKRLTAFVSTRKTPDKAGNMKLSQIEGPTQRNKHGYKYSQKQASTSVQHETQYMSIMSLEVHVTTRGTLMPDPSEDEITCVFWCLQSDIKEDQTPLFQNGIIVLSSDNGVGARLRRQLPSDVLVEHEEEELDLLNRLVDIVRSFDPDILTGYEVHNSSWGFLIERARLKYEFDLCSQLSRVKSQSHGRFGIEADRWGFTHTSTIRITGRHMINLWRAMRAELNLLQYNIENVAFHLLHRRIPCYHFRDLTSWFNSDRSGDMAITINYYLSRVEINLKILIANELLPRTSEQARLLGVDFFSVFSRGSQFKVESLMFRIAKAENFILVSPSRKQVGEQNALECLPLVMEPQSNFYTSPVLVLDFQSLYPSVMIAYNYCYSTCLGRIIDWRGQNKLGFTNIHRKPGILHQVKDHINIAPNGIMYVKPEMRKSLLARMLSEILETRVMVKSGMKMDKGDSSLQRLLYNRQLALKLIANVTYGYTSASFSGRMPCSEIADSIVQTGREILEKSIAFIHSVDRWGAEVVYGDTDSLFVHLKGRTREQAFEIGRDMADTITKINPRPIRLKFEKVYHPCVLLAKKRYVGFKYEHTEQKFPEFDAKGIETVRRDGTPAEQKIEEKALKILFRTADLSEVKRYFLGQCQKIMTGRVNVQDFIFAREVKLGTYSDRGPPPPGASIATKRMLTDHRAEPQYGERIPFVVISGAPGSRLIDRCVDPDVLLTDRGKELDAEYYITKNLIPPLERIFNLVGANVQQWYNEMPKVQRIRTSTNDLVAQHVASIDIEDIKAGEEADFRKTLENYLQSSTCLVCKSKLILAAGGDEHTRRPSLLMLMLCQRCLNEPARTLLHLRSQLRSSELKSKRIEMVCHSCSGIPASHLITTCKNRDCLVYYTRVQQQTILAGNKNSIENLITYF